MEEVKQRLTWGQIRKARAEGTLRIELPGLPPANPLFKQGQVYAYPFFGNLYNYLAEPMRVGNEVIEVDSALVM